MKRYALAIVVAIALAAGACGGDDNSNNAENSSAQTDNDGTTTSLDTSFSGKGSGDFCSAAKEFTEKFSDDENPETPDEVRTQFGAITSALKTLAREAPREIKDDAEELRDGFQAADDLYKKHNYDFEKISKDPEAQNLAINEPEFQASSERIESYLEKVCKIDADEDGDTDGVIESDSTTSTEP